MVPITQMVSSESKYLEPVLSSTEYNPTSLIYSFVFRCSPSEENKELVIGKYDPVSVGNIAFPNTRKLPPTSSTPLNFEDA